MNFKEKYTSEFEKLQPENKDKIPISDEAFAILELLDNKLERIRLSWLKQGR